jgi:hypothetical protein
MPTSIVFQALRMAQTLRLQLEESTMHPNLTTRPTRDQVRLLRTCTSIVVMYLLFNGGGSGIDCLAEDLVAFKTDGIRMYHRTRKGQCGVSPQRKLLCHLPPNVNTEVIQMLSFFDSLRHTISGREFQIDLTEKHDGWTANTLT